MVWLFVLIGYVVAVATIVRFFQFVSNTDRVIEEFWMPKEGVVGARRRVREVGTSSVTPKGIRHRSLGTSQPKRA